MTDFDRYVETYSDRVSEAMQFSECGHDFFLSAKADEFLRILRRLGPASDKRVLDVGCGIGLVERLLSGKVGHVVGVDVAANSVRSAAHDVPDASFVTYDGLSLPFPSHAFDAVFAICVMHHVPPLHWAAVVREMSRVTRPGGLVVIFEHNPWNPLTRRVVNRCEFDRGAVLLSAPTASGLLRQAQLETTGVRFLFFFPWLGRGWRRLETFLGWLPIGAQYVTMGVRPLGPSDGSGGSP